MDTAALFGLRVRTPSLVLRLPTSGERVTLGRLAQEGIHPPEQMPFAIAWTDDPERPGFVDDFVAFHERMLGEWSPERWHLVLAVEADGVLVGTQSLGAERFAQRRIVDTGSWLGERHQRRGIGTEMRAAVLALGFDGLGARAAESGALPGNAGSARVSEKLGYSAHRTETVAPRGEPVEATIYRLERERFAPPWPVALDGLEPCLPLFGVSAAP